MNKQDLVRDVTVRANELLNELGRKSTSQKVVDVVISAVTDSIIDNVSKGDDVRLIGFGTWTTVDRAGHMARNPKTGEPVEIKPHKALKFKFGSDFKDSIK